MAKSKVEKVQDSLEQLVEQLNKKFGENKLVVLGEKPKIKIPCISTGSIAVDLAMNGGYAQGRIIEIFGENASGKTTMAIHAIKEAQKLGRKVGCIDMEHSFNREYAEKIGVRTNELVFTQPDNGEEALMIAEEMLKTSLFSLIVVDSVAALIPRAELEGEIGESKMGLHARMMSQAMRKLMGLANKSNTTVIFINQIRYKIGVMYGNPETQPGGEALKFAASQRIRIAISSKIIRNGEQVGNVAKLKIIKNKIGVPHKEVCFDLIYGIGMDRVGEILDLASELEIIKKAGSWYSYNETKLAQGRDSAIDIIRDNPELQEDLEKEIILKISS